MEEESERVQYIMRYWSHIQLAREYEELEKGIKLIQKLGIPIETLVAEYERLENIEDDREQLKEEKEMYELLYNELRKQWNRMVDELLGKDYYNYGCDHYSCDEFTVDDLIYKYKRKRWWRFWKKI